MQYYFSKEFDLKFEEAINKLQEELKKEGFGIITEIDVKSTLKNKINVDFRNYKILGACNPSFAYEALKNEDKIGLMLPCNFIVQEKNNKVEISCINPTITMSKVKNPNLENLANQVKEKLLKVINSIE
ncbi:MAG: hypothetical protein KatS3mg068_0663 [Candidatus Sericytochromatia bacterium]|nr:MAG: hypothetical protein KatS3mg068_0663 [Candidatus Sericytochromatia bacterium]